MLKYIRYLFYVLQHKYYVLIECFKMGLYWQGIAHDLSKFSPTEFRSYAWNFFRTKGEAKYASKMRKDHFAYAWLHHQRHNKHHWNSWIVDQKKQEAVEIPHKYMIEMICDWKAMGRKFNDNATDYYKKNKDNIILNPVTQQKVESLLGIRK